MFRAKNHSARQPFNVMYFFALIGPQLPDFARPASITNEFCDAPDPSIWRLQRMHLPSLGIPCGSGRPVGLDGGSGLFDSLRPMTATRFCAFGQWYWYRYD